MARRTRQYPGEFERAGTFVETTHCPEAAELSHGLLASLATPA